MGVGVRLKGGKGREGQEGGATHDAPPTRTFVSVTTSLPHAHSTMALNSARDERVDERPLPKGSAEAGELSKPSEGFGGRGEARGTDRPTGEAAGARRQHRCLTGLGGHGRASRQGRQ